MCGITGKISFTQKSIETDALTTMNATLAHRGPDDTGVFIAPDGKLGLGQCRLAIIDLSPLGHQPMSYQDRYWITFNGEIYNFQEERNELLKKGYAFRSHSDTEVILALYAEYGKECVQHLRGMFAFAIYDRENQILFCARDRVGKKPFKYYLDDQVFLFASELKAILTQPEYRREPDYNAIHHFLTLQYVPAPLTGFQGIKKLEPGHTLCLDLKNGKVTKERYWKLDASQKLDLPEEEWVKRIRETLSESVKLRMIADVPLGAFLSGGIDSSAVVAFMAKNSEKPIRTFSIGFREEKYSELPYARLVAKKYGTEHTEFIVEPKALEILPFLVKHYEEPFGDSSALPTYLLSKLTREHVTVALNGDGGDENFAGYPRYSVFNASLFLERLGPLNSLVAHPLAQGLRSVLPNTFTERLERFSASLSKDYRLRYTMFTSYFTEAQKGDLYTEEFKERLHSENTYELIGNLFDTSGSSNKTEQALYTDFASYLPDDLLVKADIASMAVSLEGRSPFLDHKMLELTAQMPFSLKHRGLSNKKYILKKALEGLVPDEILHRPKMGFSIPAAEWFRTDLKEYTRRKLLDGELVRRGLFKSSVIERFLEEHCQKKISYAPHLWVLLTLELWFEEYFK